jgi:hypothetical protein
MASGGAAVREILAWVKVVENADVRQVEQQKDGFTECTAENIQSMRGTGLARKPRRRSMGRPFLDLPSPSPSRQ